MRVSQGESPGQRRHHGEFSPHQRQMLLEDGHGEEYEVESAVSFIMPIKDLLCGNVVYLLLVLSISSLYFVVSGL